MRIAIVICWHHESPSHVTDDRSSPSRLLKSRAEAIGLPLELLSGAGGLDRTISSPHIQKTGLALAGFHAYLQPARILVFGESEVRYLEASTSPTACTCWRPPSATTSRAC